MARVQCTCRVCGALFGRTPKDIARGDGKFCSRACKTTAQTGLAGPLSPSWRGGRTVSKGYVRVWTARGRQEFEHRVVWMAAHGPIPRGYVLHHVNGDKTDNRLENLALMTQSDHMRLHSPTMRHAQGEQLADTKLTETQVIAIRERYRRGGVTQLALAREYGVSETTVSHILLRRAWRHV